MKTNTIKTRGFLLAAFSAAGMLLSALNLGGCYMPGMYQQQPINLQPVNNGYYNGQAINGNGGVSPVAAHQNVASNEANTFVGYDPMQGAATGGMTLLLRQQPDQSFDRPIYYRLCIGAVCTQPSADGMPLGGQTASGWIGMIPPHRFPGADRESRTGIIRAGHHNVDVECYTGPDARQLVRIGGWSVPGGINVPGTFQANIVLAEAFCYRR